MNSAAKPVQAESKEHGFFSKIGKFLREVRAEFKRVQWPSRRETIVCTIIVLIVVAVVALFLGLADVIINFFVQTLISLGA